MRKTQNVSEQKRGSSDDVGLPVRPPEWSPSDRDAFLGKAHKSMVGWQCSEKRTACKRKLCIILTVRAKYDVRLGRLDGGGLCV